MTTPIHKMSSPELRRLKAAFEKTLSDITKELADRNAYFENQPGPDNPWYWRFKDVKDE